MAAFGRKQPFTNVSFDKPNSPHTFFYITLLPYWNYKHISQFGNYTMKTLSSLLTLIVVACTPSPSDKIPESDVIATLDGFFDALDVDNENPDLFDDYVTEDFIIYEFGKKMSKEEFWGLVSGPSPVTESEWTFDDLKISTDANTAHVSLLNTGIFMIVTDSTKVQQKLVWLESAFMVKEQHRLKIKFYFSDNIEMETDTIN